MNTLLTKRPSEAELNNYTRRDQIELNEEAFPYVSNYLPSSVTILEKYTDYIETYCVFPYQSDKEMCSEMHKILIQGLQKGRKGLEEGANVSGAFISKTGNIIGAGWDTYWKHHGPKHDESAQKRQRESTTRWVWKDLNNARDTIVRLQFILTKLEEVTGMETFLTDILQQSETGEVVAGKQCSLHTSIIMESCRTQC